MSIKPNKYFGIGHKYVNIDHSPTEVVSFDPQRNTGQDGLSGDAENNLNGLLVEFLVYLWGNNYIQI